MWSSLLEAEPALVEHFEGFLVDVVDGMQCQHRERDALETHVKRWAGPQEVGGASDGMSSI